MHGTAGGLIAGGLFLLPPVLVLLALATGYALWGELPVLASIFWALKPAVLAIVQQAAWRLGRRTLHSPALVAIALAGLGGLSVLHLPYPLLIVGAALLGWLGGQWRPGRFRAPARTSHTAAPQRLKGKAEGLRPEDSRPEPIHGDTTPTPAHGQFRCKGLALTLLATGLGLGVPLAMLSLLNGWNGMLATMARFFTRVALVSFGGANAVLPYGAQGAVNGFGWLDTSQMIDGLALGETTPGPLIMVVAFVGFLGGWNHSGSIPFAMVAALVVVWFTFLPSFAFILAGAPLVEATRKELRPC